MKIPRWSTEKFAGADRTLGSVMRAVGDAMIIAPPLVITPDEIDQLAALAKKTLDDTYAKLKADGLV